MSKSEYQFVITPPSDQAAEISFRNRTRQTLGVLTEIIQRSNNYLVIGSPYVTSFPDNIGAISLSLDAALERGVQIHIVSTSKELAGLNLSRYKGKKVYLHTPKWSKMSELGSHAKFCLADGQWVYMGSANFTYSGMNRHLEMGVFAKGEMALQVEGFWQDLLRRDFFVTKSIDEVVK